MPNCKQAAKRLRNATILDLFVSEGNSVIKVKQVGTPQKLFDKPPPQTRF